MRRNQIITVLLALAGMFPANAQYTFTLNVSWSGNCSGYTAQMNSLMGKYKSQAINGFPTRELCEQTRAMCHQELGHIELVYYDVKTGKVIKREATNCKLNVTTTPCTGRPMAGTVGSLNVLGVSQGASFYSANSANEIQNWSSDDMERMLTLNANRPFEQEQFVPIADSKYKSALVELNGKTYFRSLNVGEDGFLNTHSNDLNGADVDWQFVKAAKKLPYNTVDEFVEGTTHQYTSILDNALILANMPLSTFEYNLKQCAYDIEGWYNSESIRLANELENAEKLHDIANFMLQYKGYLAITYINGMSDNPAVADNESRKAFGKTRDELAYESIEKIEKELFEKYGISHEDITKLMKIIDDENKVQNFVEKARGLKIDKIGDKAIEMAVEKLDPIASEKSIEMFGKDYNTIGGVTGKVADKSISFDRAIDMGVLLNNDYGIWAHSKEVKALSDYVQSIKNQQNLIKEVRDKETQKIGDLITIVENNTQEMKIGVSKMSQRDKLDWANNANDILGRVNSRKTKDSYEIFPDRFRNLYIKEGTFIEYREK